AIRSEGSHRNCGDTVMLIGSLPALRGRVGWGSRRKRVVGELGECPLEERPPSQPSPASGGRSRSYPAGLRFDSSARLVKRALPRPVPIVSTPQCFTSCMRGVSLRPCSTASLCTTTVVRLPSISGIASALRQVELAALPVARQVLGAALDRAVLE